MASPTSKDSFLKALKLFEEKYSKQEALELCFEYLCTLCDDEGRFVGLDVSKIIEILSKRKNCPYKDAESIYLNLSYVKK